MKKIGYLSMILVVSLMLCSCEVGHLRTGRVGVKDASVTLNVVTMYAGNDGNAKNYADAVALFETETGNRINDNSVSSDEAFKSRVMTDYRAGAEPDVLFYFCGVDSNPLVENRRVVSINEIREAYPEYATNMKEELMHASPVDGLIYCIPVNGYWEGLFVNKKVCEAAGVQIPGADTTWSEFMEICADIRDAGYTPIAASLANVPHYWFEFCIYNHGSTRTHATVPKGIYDKQGLAWQRGLEDIKKMYESGFFPERTLSASDDETMRMFINGEAAFLLDGAWRVAGIDEAVSDPDEFMVTFVPGAGERKATDIIGGLSCGYYISRKAWEDPDKRDAAVSFVEYMTSDEMVSRFAESSATALKGGVQIDETGLSSFVKSALTMVENATGVSEAVQDYVPVESRAPIFENMPAIVKGEKNIEEAVGEVIECIK